MILGVPHRLWGWDFGHFFEIFSEFFKNLFCEYLDFWPFLNFEPFFSWFTYIFSYKNCFLICRLGHKESKIGFKLLFKLNNGRVITIFV